MLNPNFLKYKSLYELNELAFQTKYDIINSNNVQKILPPYPSFLDRRNPKGPANYERYCMQANYVSYPAICLNSVIGITNKEAPEVKLPNNMTKIIDYATDCGTSILSIQNAIVTSIFKFGLAGILVDIPTEVSITATTPKLKVYEGNKIIDHQTVVDENGEKKFVLITLDESRYIFDPKSKNYSYTKIYKVLSITAEGRYCITEMLASAYQTFDPLHPSNGNGIISITYPSWTGELNFIPFTAVSKLDTTLEYSTSFIQDLIDTSLQNFRLEANLCWLEANAAASHLVIKGRNLDDVSNYPIGAGAVHLLNDDTSQEYYVTPSTAGMTEIKDHLQENNSLIKEMMYSLTNAAANSSGEALKIRISTKMQDLVGLVKNVGRAITLSLEHIDEIMNSGINKDVIDYCPYTTFGNVEEYIKEEKIEE